MSAEWFTPAQLAAATLPDLPDERAIRIRADAEWRKPEHENKHWRRRAGRGGGYEYHLAVLPRAAQIKLAMEQAGVAAPSGPALSRDDAWAWFAKLPAKKRDEAKQRAETLDTIDTLVRAGLQVVVATLQVARLVDPESYSLDEERIGPRRAGRTRPHRQTATDATARRYR